MRGVSIAFFRADGREKKTAPTFVVGATALFRGKGLFFGGGLPGLTLIGADDGVELRFRIKVELCSHTAVDGSSHVMEFFLVIGHDAANAVFVEVAGDLGQLVAGLGELEQGILIEILVVRFEVDLAAFLQDAAVQHQEINVSQTAAGVLVRGPGVRS